MIVISGPKLKLQSMIDDTLSPPIFSYWSSHTTTTVLLTQNLRTSTQVQLFPMPIDQPLPPERAHAEESCC